MEGIMARRQALAAIAYSGAAALALVCAPAAKAQALRKLYVTNACHRPVQMLIEHADTYHNWRPQAWYKFPPGEGSYLKNAEGKMLLQLEDHEVYGYVETTDGNAMLRWQGDGPKADWQGAIYRTVKFTTRIDNDGDMVIRLTCG